MVLEAKQVLYCGSCGMPPEYCSYGPDFETYCIPWLQKNYPDVYNKLHVYKDADNADVESGNDVKAPWTTEERLIAFYTKYMPEKLDSVPALLEKYEGKEDKLFTALVKKYGEEPQDPYYDDIDDEDEEDSEVPTKELSQMEIKKRRGASAKKVVKVDTRIIVQKISRNKKKAVTIVVGMDTVPGVNLKDAAKAFSKRFAGSSSVKDTPKGGKEIIIQGDHVDEVATMIVDKFKVSADAVFMDIDGEFVPLK